MNTTGGRVSTRCLRRLFLLTLASFPTVGWAQQYDLSGLPAYRYSNPPQLHGVIRIHGTELTQHLIHGWEDAFLRFHPLVRFGDYMLPSGFSGLVAGTADINVMGTRLGGPTSKRSRRRSAMTLLK